MVRVDPTEFKPAKPTGSQTFSIIQCKRARVEDRAGGRVDRPGYRIQPVAARQRPRAGLKELVGTDRPRQFAAVVPARQLGGGRLARLFCRPGQ